MKKIAVFEAGIRFDCQRRIANGIMEAAPENDVILTFFTSDVWTMSDTEHMEGEMGIFNIPDFTLFDGVIVHMGSFYFNGREHHICQEIKDMGVPIIGVCSDIPGIHNLLVENENTIFDLVEHLILEHQVDSFGVIMGPDGNKDSEQRLRGFKQAIAAYGKKWDVSYSYVGTYHSDAGIMGIDYFDRLPGGMPRAIVCFNDEMALGAITHLQEKGYRVPEDVIVTGFDDTPLGRVKSPTITSVARQDELMGRIALERVLAIGEGKEVPEREFIKCKLVTAESCGCVDTRESITQKLAEYAIMDKHRTITYAEMIKSALADMSSVLTYDDMIFLTKKYLTMIGDHDVFLCLRSNKYPGKSYIAVGQYKNKLFYEPGEYFDTGCVLPERYAPEKTGEFDVVMPLHHGMTQYGHVIIRNSRAIIDNDIYYMFFASFNIALERLHRLNKIE